METEEEEESNLGRSLAGWGAKKGGKEVNVKSTSDTRRFFGRERGEAVGGQESRRRKGIWE